MMTMLLFMFFLMMLIIAEWYVSDVSRVDADNAEIDQILVPSVS